MGGILVPGLNPLMIRKRTTLPLDSIFGIRGILTGRLFYIQGIKASYYQHLAEDQRQGYSGRTDALYDPRPENEYLGL